MLIHDMPPEQYHAESKHYLTSHKLSVFVRSPSEFYHRFISMIAPESPRSVSFLIGEATHTLILEGEDVFRERYEIGGPINPRTQREYGRGTKKFEECCGPRTILRREFSDICDMCISVRRHAKAAKLLSCGHAEVVIRHDNFQSRIDYLGQDSIVDLKTTLTLDTFVFDAMMYEYVHQLAFYNSMASLVDARPRESWLIPVAKDDFRCDALRVSQDAIDQACRENVAAVEALTQCKRENWWPVQPVVKRTTFDIGVFS